MCRKSKMWSSTITIWWQKCSKASKHQTDREKYCCVSIYASTYILPLSFGILGSNATLPSVVLIPQSCQSGVLTFIMTSVCIRSLSHRVHHGDVTERFAPGSDTREARHLNNDGWHYMITLQLHIAWKWHFWAPRSRVCMITATLLACTRTHTQHTLTHVYTTGCSSASCSSTFCNEMTESSAKCEHECSMPVKQCKSIEKRKKKKVTDVAVWITQQSWLITGNTTALGNRGCHTWHSNNLQQHLEGGLSKQWRNLMGGTKTDYIQSCHKFHCQACAQKINRGDVHHTLHLHEKGNYSGGIILVLYNLNANKSIPGWSSNKAVTSKRPQTFLLRFYV